MATRTRMSREARQDQLLDLGAELFADSSYENVHIEELAVVAGVSRGLLYHYFPNKRAFFAAMVRRESGRISELVATDPMAPALDQLRSGIEAFLDYCSENAMGFRALYRGAASADAEIQAAIEDGIQAQSRRIMAAVEPGIPSTLLQIAVRSWLQMLRHACHEWLASDDVPRDEVRDLLVDALASTLLGLPADKRPSGISALDLDGLVLDGRSAPGE